MTDRVSAPASGAGEPRKDQLAAGFAKWWQGWREDAKNSPVTGLEPAPLGFSNETWFVDLAWQEAGLPLRQRDVKSLVPQVAVAGFTGVTAAALQIGTPANMRGQLSAIYLLVFNLVGLSLGPTAVAVFTDYVFADEAMIGWSLLVTCTIFAPFAALLMLWTAPAMHRRVLIMRETRP